jgi:uncharacterized protein CbrC (UPF0167 family)
MKSTLKINCMKCGFVGKLEEYLSALDKDDSSKFMFKCLKCGSYQKFGDPDDYKDPTFYILTGD